MAVPSHTLLHGCGRRVLEAVLVRSYAARVLRVIVAEDSLLVREGVVALLRGDADAGIDVVGEVGDLRGLLDGVTRLRPDVVVTDIRMPPTHRDEGIRAAALLRERAPSVGVVVLSQYADPQYAVALLEQGSAGRAFLLKDRLARAGQLVEAVTVVADGGSVVDPAVVEGLIAARSAQERSRLAALSVREREVLAEMARGRSNAGIAEVLFLSEATVEKHINALLAKLGLPPEPHVHRRVRAVLLFLEVYLRL
jgi:DNA-binding NarL/FixJ family response regulator